jgi:hypothetical protein
MKYKDLYAKLERESIGLGFLLLVLAALILVVVPANCHFRINNFGSHALGPCFFVPSANADPSNFDNYSGYSVIVEKVQKNDKSNAKDKQKTMYINGREYILR